MLGSIKEKIKGWVAYTVIALIIVPFALFGVNQYFSGASKIAIAKIDGKSISKREFLSEFELQKRALQQKLGAKYTPKINQMVKIQTINSMINDRLLEKLVDDLGYATTQHELQALIQSNDIFWEKGKFSIDKYRQLLRLNGFSEVEYESLKAKELRQNQIKSNFLDSAFVTPQALKRLQLLNDQERKFSYITLNIKDYIQKVRVSEKSIKEFYESKKQRFIEPQKVKVDFVALSFKELAKDKQVSEDELLHLYQAEQVRWTTEEERRAQHILVKTKTLANKIIKKLKAGDDFKKLAKQYSIDTSSANKGGDLGFFGLGVMVPEFEAKVFSMKAGEISPPVKTDFGYHIIKLNSVKVANVKPFKSVRTEVEKLWRARTAQKLAYQLSEEFANLAYEESLEGLAEQMNLKLKTSDFFQKGSKKYNAKFIKAAYSDAVLNKGENSAPIELSKDKLVVLRINKKIAPKQKPFAEVKGEITQYLATLLAKTAITNVANKIISALNQGDMKTAKQLMDKNKLKWKKLIWVKRNARKANIAIINSVFSMPKPSKNKPITYALKDIDLQSLAILKLTAVKSSLKHKNSAALATILLNLEADQVFKSILTILRKKSDIEIFTDNLESIN